MNIRFDRSKRKLSGAYQQSTIYYILGARVNIHLFHWRDYAFQISCRWRKRFLTDLFRCWFSSCKPSRRRKLDLATILVTRWTCTSGRRCRSITSGQHHRKQPVQLGVWLNARNFFDVHLTKWVDCQWSMYKLSTLPEWISFSGNVIQGTPIFRTKRKSR